MKSFLIKIFITIFIVSLFANFGVYIQASIQNEITIRIDEEVVYISQGDQHPIILEDRTLVPFRVVMEAAGFYVDWYEDSQMVVVQRFGPNIHMWITIGLQEIIVNSDILTIDVPAQIINDRTMIPIRAILESANMDVYWDSENRIVDISTNIPPIVWNRPDYWPEHLPEHVPGSVELERQGDFVGFIDPALFPLRYRALFYGIPGQFEDLVPSSERNLDLWWHPGVLAGEIMPLALFVQHYNISRESFDEAVELAINARLNLNEWRLYHGINFNPYKENEWSETPNADIIFTFDHDIIRYFYRRE